MQVSDSSMTDYKTGLELNAVVQQPTIGFNIPKILTPSMMPDEIPELHRLKHVDTLIVKQKLEWFELLTGCEVQNRFEVRDAEQTLLFEGKEESSCCGRLWCGPLRPFEMLFRDPVTKEAILRLVRPFSCQGFACPCCLQSMSVYCPPGIAVGSIQEMWGCHPHYSVKSPLGEEIFVVHGPLCPVSWTCRHIHYPVTSSQDGSEIAVISKLWRGCLLETFTDADNFQIKFSAHVPGQMKALLLGVLILLDVMFFERTQSNSN